MPVARTESRLVETIFRNRCQEGARLRGMSVSGSGDNPISHIPTVTLRFSVRSLCQQLNLRF